VARKTAAGLYPTELLTDIELSQDQLGIALVGLGDAAGFSSTPPTASGRARFGTVVSGAKRMISKALGWYTRWMVDQMHTFGANVVATTSNIVTRLREQDAALSEIRHELIGVQRRLRELEGAPGSPEALPQAAARPVATYLDLFRGVPGQVVDLGCGRGEFLDLMRAADIPGYGVDAAEAMVVACRERGLDARQEDILGHLAAVPQGSLGGVFCAHAIAHLEPAGVVRFFELAGLALAETGVLVVETPNAQSVNASTNGPSADLGHPRPLHPPTLRFLAESAGFRDVETLFGPQDLAVVARR
jgi:SAM-dependent methyltransferase